MVTGAEMDIECTRNLGGRCSPSVGRIWWRLRVWKKDQLFYLRSQEGGGEFNRFHNKLKLDFPKNRISLRAQQLVSAKKKNEVRG